MSLRTILRVLIMLALLAPVIPTVVLAQNDDQVVVVADNFDDPAVGILPVQRDDEFRYAYDDGGYEIDAFADDFSGDLTVPVPGEFPNGTITIDAALTGKNDSNGHYLFLGCRIQDDTGYKLEIRPLAQVVAIWLLSPDGNTRIANMGLDIEPSSGPFTIAFSCLGNELTGYMDGQEVISVTDSTYDRGSFTFGAGVYKISAGKVSADFDNLSIAVPADEAPATPEASLAAVEQPVEPATPKATEAPAESAPPEATVAPAEEPTQTPTPEPTQAPTGVPAVSQAATFDRSGLAAAADQLRAQASAQQPLFGPESGQTDLDTGQQLADFVATASFTAPESESWSAGFAFRQTGDNSALLLVSSDGAWMLTAGTEQVRAAGVVDTLDTTPGNTNTIELIATGDTGYLTVDGQFVAQLDLSIWPDAGNLTIIGTIADGGGPLEVSDATVWPIGNTELVPMEPTATASPVPPPVEEATPPPASPESGVVSPEEAAATFQQIVDSTAGENPLAGPQSGSLTQAIGSLDIANARVITANFYSTVQFSNPDNPDAPDHPWDIVLGFWHTGGNDQVRLVIASDGAWSLALGTARPILNGTIDNLNLGQDGQNEIGLAVLDGTGYLVVNGVFVTSFDIPTEPRAGDLWLASGTFPENAQEGVQTSFSDWTVWSLEQG